MKNGYVSCEGHAGELWMERREIAEVFHAETKFLTMGGQNEQ